MGDVSAEVHDEFDGESKSKVYVENTGNVPVYVRAYVSIYLQKADGTILSRGPEEGEDKDYTITWGDLTNWEKQGDIYYYLLPVEPDERTENLIETVTETTKYGEILVVDISTQAIQAEPAKAVQDAWSVTVEAAGSLALPGNANP